MLGADVTMRMAKALGHDSRQVLGGLGDPATGPDKDLAAVMTERFGHRHGYVGGEYGLGE